MASDVDICNLALAHLGDTATVASINPPEGSAQADHCARFYPIARNAMLEMHSWSFATKRVSLGASLVSPASDWLYCYAQPTDVVNLLGVLDPNASDDYSIGIPPPYPYPGFVGATPNVGVYTPQPFSPETLTDGTQVILTNQQNALLRYTALITDPTKFTPLFIVALSDLLASYLAGPVLKGESGTQAAQAWLNQFQIDFAKATASDANQRRIEVVQDVDWMTGRV